MKIDGNLEEHPQDVFRIIEKLKKYVKKIIENQ